MNSKVRVFREDPAFLKLFRLFKEKYRSLGRIGGTVSLKGFTDEELDTISGFLGTSKGKLLQKGSLSLLDFEKELAETSYSEFQLLSLMEKVLQEKIIPKKVERELEHKAEMSFIQALVTEVPEAEWWLYWIAEKPQDSRWIWNQYKRDKEKLQETIVKVFHAFSSLPREGEFERLPLFSQRITGNPHYFDGQELGGRLLQHFMYVDQASKGNKVTMPKTNEELNDLLAEYRILRDDLWNFVTCQQLLAGNEMGMQPVWEAACQSKSVLNMPMKELIKISQVWPVNGNKVWVVENSSVSSTLMDALPDAPIVCTHGQLRISSWRLLDLLVASDCTLYYSGDLDPEGLIIAEKLKRRYGGRIVFWRMDLEAYQLSISNEGIADRLSKINNLDIPELAETVEMMRNEQKAGYQEALLEQLVEDIKKNLHADKLV